LARDRCSLNLYIKYFTLQGYKGFIGPRGDEGKVGEDVRVFFSNKNVHNFSCTPISSLTIYMKKFLNSDWLRAVQFFRNTVKKKKCSANFIDYLAFLIGLKYKTMTKIANKIQQCPAEMIQKTNIWECIQKWLALIFFMYVISK
jgi:hypothetical protein